MDLLLNNVTMITCQHCAVSVCECEGTKMLFISPNLPLLFFQLSFPLQSGTAAEPPCRKTD